MPKQGLQNLLNHSFIKDLIILLALYSVALITAAPILHADIMYPEQPTIYLLNQTIHSWHDLLNVYLHPRALDSVIPFFRPSGHFLMYQLLTPLFGWHNTRALIAVNMLFLALSGLVLIKLYQRLFPTYKLGAYLAFGLYLLHPALIMSRYLLLHFEFAYVFFLLLSLYLFVIFCQKNIAGTQFKNFSWLSGVILTFFVAVTFKESAIMLGPVLFTYFVINFYQRMFRKQAWEIIFLLIAATVSYALYLTLAWPTLHHPQMSHDVGTWAERFAIINQFLKDFLGTKINLLTNKSVSTITGGGWRYLVFTPTAHILILSLTIAGLVNTGWVICKSKNLELKKSILFLFIAVVLFLVLPCYWGSSFPWHWNLSILFLSLILGFGVEHCLKICIQKHWLLNSCVAALFLCQMMVAININALNIKSTLQIFPLMSLTRQAVFNPPDIRNQLNADSIILVATTKESAYELGNARYNFLAMNATYDDVIDGHEWIYRQFDDWRYNGTLFKWAYLMPELREEIFPFRINKLQTVPTAELYQWLDNLNNIFCFTLDTQWHNVTDQFRKNVLLEKERRHLARYAYDVSYTKTIKGTLINTTHIFFPDSKLCEYACNQNIYCKGFVYFDNTAAEKPWVSCSFFSSASGYDSEHYCLTCKSYVKQKQIPF